MPTPVSLSRARQLFELVDRQVCCAASAAAPCIPFTYPDDGCWGRAHEMCRLMIADGADPEKVWIFGNLSNVATLNNPACQISWGWHVAPTLQVDTSGGVSTYVVDPSLFREPVTQATWASVQNDPAAVLIPSSASIFFRNQSGTTMQTDPTYALTNGVLSTYRTNLRLRTASNGPPPYLNCIVKPPGTQWLGTIPGNGEQHWFTYGWSPSSHVVWTIMPLSPCPGGPQLTFSAQIERASTTQATHWITVRNLTADDVRFEGRYDILRL